MSDSGAIRLEFSRSLYSESAVQDAVAAYDELAVFVVEANEHTVCVTVADPHPDLTDLADHFANHVLFSTVGGERRGQLS